MLMGKEMMKMEMQLMTCGMTMQCLAQMQRQVTDSYRSMLVERSQRRMVRLGNQEVQGINARQEATAKTCPRTC